MIQEVYRNIFLQEIPLAGNPLKAVNCYVIKGEAESDGGGNLIVDTGFNTEPCKEALMEGILALGLDMTKTALLITHLHSDHSGLAAALNNEGIPVYAGRIDGAMVNEMAGRAYWEVFEGYKVSFDLIQDQVSLEDHPGYRYCPKGPVPFKLLDEGDILRVGEYCFEVIDIPGHTPGHIGLYERKHKLFFCGDHILDRITPNIAFWGFDRDILAVYFESLKKVAAFQVDYLFTAHRNIVRDHRRRINELLEHHQRRLQEILEILKTGEKTVKEIAARMHWDLKAAGWQDFPRSQKWFAAGEAMSHLEHLVYEGKAGKRCSDGILYYFISCLTE